MSKAPANRLLNICIFLVIKASEKSLYIPALWFRTNFFLHKYLSLFDGDPVVPEVCGKLVGAFFSESGRHFDILRDCVHGRTFSFSWLSEVDSWFSADVGGGAVVTTSAFLLLAAAAIFLPFFQVPFAGLLVTEFGSAQSSRGASGRGLVSILNSGWAAAGLAFNQHT